MGEIFLKQVLGLMVLLVFGGLMSAAAAVLLRLVDRWESPPEPRVLGSPGLTPPIESLRPAATPPHPAREPAPSSLKAPITEEPLLAGAIALALTLYNQELKPAPRAVSGGVPGSPWALAGRVQAMQSRLRAQKR